MQSPTAPIRPARPARLCALIAGLERLVDGGARESVILHDGAALLRQLVATDDWLPEVFAQPNPARYQQFLLHADPRGRFSIVSFVWGPGQATPIHDHTVWGLIGMLRGAESSQAYEITSGGNLQAASPEIALRPGEVAAVSPAIGDIHRVRNLHDDQVSISIHIYGADIGSVQRHVYAPDGTRKLFISGYSNACIVPFA